MIQYKSKNVIKYPSDSNGFHHILQNYIFIVSFLVLGGVGENVVGKPALFKAGLSKAEFCMNKADVCSILHKAIRADRYENSISARMVRKFLFMRFSTR